MLVRSRCSLSTLEREGVSRAVIEAYLHIGFVEVDMSGAEWSFSLDDAERLCRAERIRRELGANLIGAALVVEVLERYGA